MPTPSTGPGSSLLLCATVLLEFKSASIRVGEVGREGGGEEVVTHPGSSWRGMGCGEPRIGSLPSAPRRGGLPAEVSLGRETSEVSQTTRSGKDPAGHTLVRRADFEKVNRTLPARPTSSP